jgi:putative redox protein
MSTTAKISWVDGALFVAEGGSGHTLTMDGAPTSVAAIRLAADGGRADGHGRLHRDRCGVDAEEAAPDIEGVEVSLSAERRGASMVFTEVTLVYTVRGRKLNKALVERAVSLSTKNTARPPQ